MRSINLYPYGSPLVPLVALPGSFGVIVWWLAPAEGALKVTCTVLAVLIGLVIASAMVRSDSRRPTPA